MLLALLALGFVQAPGAGGPIPAVLLDQPVLHANDSWHYKNTIELEGHFSETHDESTVVRTQADALVLKVHASDSPLQPTELLVGSDWSRFRSVDGQEQVVNRPFSFPLAMGKTWSLDFRETNPNRNFSSERWVVNYRVVGTERIVVPAGMFDTVKIEATGHWTATVAPTVTGVVTTRSDAQGVALTNRLDRQVVRDATGRLYKAFWYSPQVKRAVKVVEESYNSAGVRTERRTSEIESFKVTE